MKYKHYNITDKNGKSNCVIRSLCKILNEEYETIYNELNSIKEELKKESYNDVEVFETFMKRNNITPIKYGKDIKIKDLKLEKESFVVFCWDKKDFYHMVTIINNILYDKDNRSLELSTINIYKQKH